MTLPYSLEVFFASMEQYNEAYVLAVPVAALLSLVALALALRPLAGRERTSARLVGAILAVFWIWVGAAHQLHHMATLNFLAPVYGYAWIAEGALIAASGTLIGRMRWRFGGDVRGRIGLALAVIGLVVYPAVVLALGHDWRALPIAGTAPDPTAILTAGFLAAARDRPPLYLFVIPLGWAGVAGFSAFVLAFPLDYAVPAAVIAAAALAIAARIRGAS